MAETETIAVLGAGGTMGFAVARNLARAGHSVNAWNRSRDKAEPLADDGATVTDSPGEAAKDAKVILTILADADAVLECAEEALEAAGDGVVWLQMSTIGEAGFERCAELASAHGAVLVDAPVLGTKQPAEEGKLVVLASGPEDQRELLQPLFDVVGQRTMWVGEAGTGTRLKLATNSWVLTVVEGAAETLALAQGLDLDPSLVLEAVKDGPLDMPYLQMKGRSMLERKFEPSFRLELAAKDARLVAESAERRELDLPLVETLRDRLAEGAQEHGDQDMAATYLTSAQASTS